MSTGVFSITKEEALRKAGPSDLIELVPLAGDDPLYLPKMLLEELVCAIVTAEFIHLSGPTGSAKSALLEALHLAPENFTTLCAHLGFAVKPLKVFPIEMAIYEAPGDLWGRRALRGGSTLDEPSRIVEAIKEAAAAQGFYPLIWLREIGRVMSAAIQGGLLNLMVKGDVVLPGGERINGRRIAWVADSNYQAEGDSTHTLVTFDDALRRRFSINLTLDYLRPVQEMQVLAHIMVRDPSYGAVDKELIKKVVQMGVVIRKHRSEGNLLSVPPPTIYGYLSFLRFAKALSHLSLQHVAQATLLGNASRDDDKFVQSVLAGAFGLKPAEGEDAPRGANLL